MLNFEIFFSILTFTGSFLLVLVFGFFLPGYLFLRTLAPKANINVLEASLYSFALGLGLINASLLFLGNIQIALNSINIGFWNVLLYALFLGILRFRKISFLPKSFTPIFQQSRFIPLGILILIFIFFVKVFYLSSTILPTSTDLGHHLYWAKLTSDTQALPVYEKQEILQTEGNFSLSEPEAISDFIIGEHLPLSFLQIFTGASYFGTFPILFLFLLNLAALLALASLFTTLVNFLIEKEKWSSVNPSTIFLLALFVFGGIFSLASPEMKFVSGGVIGNLFGNFYIPVLLALLFRFLTEKKGNFFALFLFVSVTLAFTHHLSTFILLYVLAFFLITLVVFLRRDFFTQVREWFLSVLTPSVIGVLGAVILFLLFVALPTYLETNAVTTAVGTPTKSTRTGLTVEQLTLSNSSFKLGFAFFTLLLILGVTTLRKNIATLLLFAYGVVLLIMTLAPNLLFVDIPSNRISHYLSFPLTLLALLGIVYLWEKSAKNLEIQKTRFFHPVFASALFLLFLTLIAPGMEDNNQALSTNQSRAQYVQETFQSAEFLKDKVKEDELVLKDHNFIQASDTWMKLFFNRDYNYPLSRSYFKRYEDNPDREQCTLAMIATPNTPFGKKCYQDLPVRYLIVNPNFDQGQFTKSSQFSQVYSSPTLTMFQYNR